jgi:hypothetical protein
MNQGRIDRRHTLLDEFVYYSVYYSVVIPTVQRRPLAERWGQRGSSSESTVRFWTLLDGNERVSKYYGTNFLLPG